MHEDTLCDICSKPANAYQWEIHEPDIDFDGMVVWVMCSWRCFREMVQNLEDELNWLDSDEAWDDWWDEDDS